MMVQEEKNKNSAEAIICGESYDVNLIEGPDGNDMCLVDVLFDDGNYAERLGVYRKNVYPVGENAIFLMTKK